MIKEIQDTGRRLSRLAMTIAIVIYLPSVISPPSLMDDTDAVEAQIARTMLSSGDWVTARLTGTEVAARS